MAPPNPTIQTSKGLSSILSTSQVLQVSRYMPTLYEKVARLTTLALKESKKPVANTTFGHNESQPLPFMITFNGTTETSAGGTLTVADFTNGSVVLEDDLWFNPDGKEVFHVSNAPTTTFTADRNIGGGSQVLKNGAKLYRIGNTREEGATSARASKTTQETWKQFYLQQHNWTKKFTDVSIGVETYFGPVRVNEHKKMMIEAKLDLELGGYFGKVSSDVGGTTWAQPTAQGLDQTIEGGGNVRSYVNLTFDEIEACLRDQFAYHAEGWDCWAGVRAGQRINGFTRGHLQMTQDETSYGQRVNRLHTTFGDVDIQILPLLAGPFLQDYLWFTPKPFGSYIFLRYFAGNGENHDFKMHLNTQANDSQTMQDELRVRLGWEYYEAYKFAKMYQATS